MKYLFIIAVLFTACNPARKLQQQQDKALSTVLASKAHLDKAGAAWALINPCTIGTDFEIIPGDSIPYPVLYVDNAEVLRMADSITLTKLVDCVTDVRAAYQRGFTDGLAKIPKTKFKAPDTTKIKTTDLRMLELLKNKNLELKAQNDALNNSLMLANSRAADQENKTKGKVSFSWYWILLAVAGAGVFITKRLGLW